jgi:hypothetical protein
MGTGEMGRPAMTYVQDFFAYYEIEHRDQQVTLDLIDDIWARCDLTANVRTTTGPEGIVVQLVVHDGRLGAYVIQGAAGGLPDDYGLTLMHDGEEITHVASNGSLLGNARASNLVCDYINSIQRAKEREAVNE